MEEYHISLKEKHAIHGEAQFDAESFKTACPDMTVQADSMITLATKTDKDAPVRKLEKYTRNKTPPPPSASTHTLAAPLHKDEFHSPTPPDFLNIKQREKMHESQLVRLAKAIPSMIPLSIKKALHPAKDKLTCLCSTVDVLEREVVTLRQEVATLSAAPPTCHPTPREPEVMPDSPKHPRVHRIIGGWGMIVIQSLCPVRPGSPKHP
ncbi:hypothetical protein HAX54_052696 [Datura stramonium]|uniref:BHLH domain-containing protein n=1 Tax=Datura stramonium TaxID=4076 RepID=A0ABS8SZA5_DATST|nr:hypothetical protein [Datura stramonium]